MNTAILLFIAGICFWLSKGVWDYFRKQEAGFLKVKDPIENQLVVTGVALFVVGVVCLLAAFGVLDINLITGR